MKIKLDNLEVEIKAKTPEAKGFNNQDTIKFLNDLITVYFNASVRAKTDGDEVTAQRYNHDGCAIFMALDKAGAYDILDK